MAEVQRVDGGARTFLPLCSCGWRGSVSLLRSAAWRDAARHAAHSHGGGLHALDAARKQETREAAVRRA